MSTLRASICTSAYDEDGKGVNATDIDVVDCYMIC